MLKTEDTGLGGKMPDRNTLMQEYQALFYLQTLFPSRYASLEHVSGNESPDLQDREHSIGVEVTQIKNGQEMKKAFDRYCGKSIGEIPKRILEKAKEEQYAFGCWDQRVSVLFGPHAYEWMSPESFSQESNRKTLAVVKRKTEILNKGHYHVFCSNELFVFSDNTFFEESAREITRAIADYQRGFSRQFSTVFVKRPNTIILCDLKSVQYQAYDISSIFGDITERAFLRTELTQKG